MKHVKKRIGKQPTALKVIYILYLEFDKFKYLECLIEAKYDVYTSKDFLFIENP